MITGDDAKGRPRPDRGFKINGLPMTFRLEVMYRQGCYKDKDGRLICLNDDQYEFDRETKILVKSADERPVAGDVLRWKDRLREPDVSIGTIDTQGMPLSMYEPGLSATHLNHWEATGQDCYIYDYFVVDDNRSIVVPIKNALAMLTAKQWRSNKVKQWEKVDRPKNGEAPRRRIANWLFKEIPMNKENIGYETNRDKESSGESVRENQGSQNNQSGQRSAKR